MVTDRITWIIERAAAAGFVLVRACDLNEETQDGETLGSSLTVHSDGTKDILSNGNGNGN